jgi:glycosyltransferase involved in cell wall biosynthesis
MFRVARHLAVTVLSPQPWFPGQALLRRIRPDFRPPAPAHEVQEGIEVFRPRFLALPVVGRRLDGLSIAISSFLLVRRLRRTHAIQVIDAHFAYPDGSAAVRLGKWLDLPVTVTMRGTEVRYSRMAGFRGQVVRALDCATRVFAVSTSLRDLARSLGAGDAKTQVVGNGVDLARFHPIDRDDARRALALPPDARVLISVGGLVERKGMHRVLACMPALLSEFPDLHYLIVGGASAEGDMRDQLERMTAELRIRERVHFAGSLPPDALKGPLSAADVFVLATRNEGWANVFLEAMACGIPVITTDVGGNREVVCRPELGTVVPFGDHAALLEALRDALGRRWAKEPILRYASDNQWDQRVRDLVVAFDAIAHRRKTRSAPASVVESRR